MKGFNIRAFIGFLRFCLLALKALLDVVDSLLFEGGDLAGGDLVFAGNLLAGDLQLTRIGENEVGLVRYDGVAAEVLAPNTQRVYWRGLVDVKVERQDVSEDFALPTELAAVLFGPVWVCVRAVVEVPDVFILCSSPLGIIKRLLHSGRAKATVCIQAAGAMSGTVADPREDLKGGDWTPDGVQS